MPKIGRIDVPDDFFEIFKRKMAFGWVDENLLELGQKLQIDSTQETKHIVRIDQEYYPGAFAYLIALVRIQTKDYVRNDDEIEKGEDYMKVWREADLQSRQMFQELLHELFPIDNALITAAKAQEAHTHNNDLGIGT